MGRARAALRDRCAGDPVAFALSNGDGVYSTYAGFDADGQLVGLLLDGGLAELDDAG